LKLLAIDTATEQCSVALLEAQADAPRRLIERSVLTGREHAERVLPMVEEVLAEGGCAIGELDGLAFGRGPGAFTGVRIAAAVVQGIATATGLPVVGVSDLAAVAQRHAGAGRTAIVCMDARMGEVYWGVFGVDGAGRCEALTPERVSAPAEVIGSIASLPRLPEVAAGTGFSAYPLLRDRFASLPMDDKALPHAREVAELALAEFQAGRAVAAREAIPSYVRDRVVSSDPKL